MKRKKVIQVFIITILLLLFCSNSFATTVNYQADTKDMQTVFETEEISNEKKVYDFANVLTEEEELSLYARIKVFIEDKNIDLIIITKDKSIETSDKSFASEFYSKYDFGKGEDKKGFLVVINTFFKKIYVYHPNISPNYIGVSTTYEDLKENATTYLKDGQYYKAADEMITQLDRNRFPLISIFFISCFFATIVALNVSKKYRKKPQIAIENNYVEKVTVTQQSDRYIDVVQYKI